MVSILEKLSARMVQRQKKQAASWSQFVSDVTDEKLKDPDELLAGLEVLGKSPKELQAACELLIQRRQWSGIVAAGNDAENEYPKLTQQAVDAEKTLKDFIEKHEARQLPLERKLEQARTAISNAADARRRLLDTVPPGASAAVYGDIDSQIAETGVELDSVRRSIRDCERWVAETSANGDTAATEDAARLSSQRVKLKDLRKSEADLAGKLSALQDERNAAAVKLLSPGFV